MIIKKPRRPRATLRSPYPGIRPFRRDEARIFFGRDEQIDALLQRLERNRFLAVVGTSGSGKSSLVKAGLLPKIEAGELGATGSNWFSADLRPGNTPVLNLAREILRSGILGEDWPNDEEKFDVSLGLLVTRLRVGPKALVQVLRDVELPSHTNLLILADQFEEIFRFYNDKTANEALRFVNLLMATAHDDEVSVHVVMTMRSDFLGECALFPGLPELLNDTQFLCPRLSRDQMREAILLPARSFDGEVEPALASALVCDVGSNSDQLPLIQHCLARMWEKTPHTTPRPLTLSQYREEPVVPAMRPVFAAMSNHADDILRDFLAADLLRLIELIFRALVTRGPSGQIVRRSITLRQLAEECSPTLREAEVDRIYADVVKIVDVFRGDGHNFLMPSTTEKPALEPDTMIDVSHESLLRQWQKVAGWLQTETRAAAELRNLVHEANRWNEKKEKQLLLRDLRLAQVHEWQRKLPSEHWPLRYVTKEEVDLAREYLRQSEVNQNEIEAAEQQRQQAEREREIERRTFREKLQREWAERKTRRTQFVVAGVTLGLLLAIAIGLFTYRSLGKTEEALEEANTQRKKANEATQIAVEAQGKALTAQLAADNLAENQTRMADTFRMLTYAKDSQDGAPQRSALVGIEALRLARTVEGHPQMQTDASDSLRASLSKIGGIALYANQGQIDSIALHQTADGGGILQWVAAAGRDSSLVVWDLRNGVDQARQIPLKFGYEAPVRGLRITNDGRWLIAKSGADLHTVWKLAALNEKPYVIKGYSDHHHGVASKKSYLLLTQPFYGSNDAQLENIDKLLLFDLEHDDAFKRPIYVDDPLSYNYSFSKDGNWLASVAPDATADLYDLRKAELGELLKPLRSVGPKETQTKRARISRPLSGAFSDDSRHLIWFLSDGTVRTWSLEGDSWAKVNDRLLEGIDDSLSIATRADPHGRWAVVATQAKKVDANKSWTARLFDLNMLDCPIELGGIDAEVLGNSYVKGSAQVDDTKTWFAIRYGDRPQSGNHDGVRIWNLKDANTNSLDIGHDLIDFQLTPDGRRLIGRGTDNAVRLWELKSVTKENRSPIMLRGHDGSVSSFALQPTPSRANEAFWLVTGGTDGSLRIWDLNALNTSADRTTYRAPANRQYGRLSPNNATFALSSTTGNVLVWNLAEGLATTKPDYIIATKHGDYPTIGLSDDGRWLLTSQIETGAAELWDLRLRPSPSRVCQLKDIKEPVLDFQVSDDARWLVARVKTSRTVSIFYADLDGKGSDATIQLVPLPKHSRSGFVSRFVNGKPVYWVIGGGNVSLQQLDRPERKPVGGSKNSSDLFLQLSPDNSRLVVKYEQDAFRLFRVSWDEQEQEASLENQELRTQPDASLTNGWFGLVSYSYVSNRWAVLEAKAAKDQTKLFVWDLNSRDAQIFATSIDVLPSRTPLFKWSPDGRWLLTNPTGPGELWDLNSEPKEGRPEWISLGHFESSAFSLDGSRLITSANGKINVWRLPPKTESEKQQKPELEKQFVDDVSHRVEHAAASKNGKRLVVSSGSKARVWDLQKDQPILTLGMPQPNYPLAFLNHNGSYVVLVVEALNSLSTCALDEALEKTAAKTIGRNLSKKEWADLHIAQNYPTTFPELPVPVEPIVLPPMLRAAQPREKPAKTAVSQLRLSQSLVLTDADPLDKKQRAASKRVPIQLEKGNRYVIDMKRKGEKLDPFLRLENPEGRELASNDDFGDDLDSRITYFCDRSGTFTIVATSFNRALGPFELSVQEHAVIPAESELTVENDIALKEAQLQWEDYEIAGAPCKVYGVRLSKGQSCQIDLVSDDFDAVLRVEEDEGGPLYFNDNGGGGANARIVFNCERTGVYRIVVTAAVPRTGAFHLKVQTR